MRATTVVMLLILVALCSAGSRADDCRCVYPWPAECNKACFRASGTVKSFKENTAVLAVDEKGEETFPVSEYATGKGDLKEGNRVTVFGRLKGLEKLVTEVKRM